MTGQSWPSNQPAGPRGGPPWPPNTPGYFRVSQAERDAVAEQLRQHTTDGRLSLDEFGERLDACLRAKTYDELGQVLRDLPAQHPHPQPAPPQLPPAQHNVPPHVLVLWAALTAAVAAVVFTGHVFPFVFLAVWCAVMVHRAHHRSWNSPPPTSPGRSPSAPRPPRPSAPRNDWYHHYPPTDNTRRGPYRGGYDQQV